MDHSLCPLCPLWWPRRAKTLELTRRNTDDRVWGVTGPGDDDASAGREDGGIRPGDICADDFSGPLRVQSCRQRPMSHHDLASTVPELIPGEVNGISGDGNLRMVRHTLG